ncbi:MAG: tRNA pseudouridine(54/55) synthase Pus10 [Methanobacteriota archaeon]|nr:MAG: tRNA pseudouridine(54/55) synthase Pus10 [Euryarchaeota archaeon]
MRAGVDLEAIAELAQRERLCLGCTGRLAARRGHGLTNHERGQALLATRAMLAEAADETGTAPFFHGATPAPAPDECGLCAGLCGEVESLAQLVLDAVVDIELATFQVGTLVDAEILSREKELQAGLGNHGEPLKSQLNREIGSRVADASGLEPQRDSPDAVIVVDTRYDTVDLQIRSLFIEGRYTKADRTIPQTRWPCRHCRGRGCERCDGSGQMYPDSVQSLVAAPLLEASGAGEDKFHGMGREDIDAAMLGAGRPFVLELRQPRVRSLDLPALEKAINVAADGRITANGLAWVARPRVAELKETVCDKTYRVDIRCDPPVEIERLKKGAQRLAGEVVEQRTPTRVSHRRADLVRPRRVESMKLLSADGATAELEIRAQHGTYIRELVSGDGGRTSPSLAELVEAECRVEVLDVLHLHLEEPET